MAIEKRKKYRIGYTCGVFDLFHVGHLNLLERCKSMCEILIVGVCNDNYVRSIKKKEPILLEQDRVRIINALKVVDVAYLVDIAETEDKLVAHSRFNYDVLFSGDDWKGTSRYNATERQFEKIGVKIEYLPYTKGISTSQIKQLLGGQEK